MSYLLSYVPADLATRDTMRELLSKHGVDMGPFSRNTGAFELCIATFKGLRYMDDKKHLGERIGGHAIGEEKSPLYRFVQRARLAIATFEAGQRHNAELVEHELMDEVLRYIHQGGALHVIASRIALTPSVWSRP